MPYNILRLERYAARIQAGTYVKLQQAYAAESNATGGNQDRSVIQIQSTQKEVLHWRAPFCILSIVTID